MSADHPARPPARSTERTVDHGDLRLGFLPGVGGRLISLQHRGRELLYRRSGPSTGSGPGTTGSGRGTTGSGPGTTGSGRSEHVVEQLAPETDMSSWWNLGGSKTWPAPQEAWGGPPDPVLDGGAYSFTATRSGGVTRVVMVSPADLRTGLEITREFVVGPRPGGFDQLITLRNVVDRPITWAPWEICQVDTAVARPASVHVDVGASAVLDLGRYVGEPTVTETAGAVEIPVVAAVAKWGFTAAPTAISIVAPDLTLSLGFVVDPAGTYPDGGCAAELWMQHPTAEPVAVLDDWRPDAWLVELEVLGQLVTLAPGDATELAISWDIAAT